jgi:hypothetical protein
LVYLRLEILYEYNPFEESEEDKIARFTKDIGFNLDIIRDEFIYLSYGDYTIGIYNPEEHKGFEKRYSLELKKNDYNVTYIAWESENKINFALDDFGVLEKEFKDIIRDNKLKKTGNMKEYPYIGIILYEFYETMRKDLIEGEMFFVTNVYEGPKNYSPGHEVYGVRFIKEKWNSERMLDLPVKYYKERLNYYKSIERNIKLNKLGI